MYVLILALLLCLPAVAAAAPQAEKTGADLYRTACASCHAPDGKGMPRATVGFDIPLPDFTDCGFATPEADADWMAVIHMGGPARAFDRMMPAFTEALTADEIGRIVEYLRGFCRDNSWPRGDLNLPRPLVTEKAFPENEAVLTTSVDLGEQKAIGNEFLYERRLGRRAQIELAVPIEAAQRGTGGGWVRGVGDAAVAIKQVLFDSLPRGSILSAGAELVLPTGDRSEGLGTGATVFEPFATLSQILPRDAFLHLHAGLELPAGEEGVEKEVFWRAAFGKAYTQGWGRAWSPMIELLAARELKSGEDVLWDVVPQMQVSLSTRQHVLINAGVRIPVNHRPTRDAAIMVYLLWDWFDGGFFSGW